MAHADCSPLRGPLGPWPLFELRIRTPRLELRAPSDDDAQALAELASRGVHDPEFMPFEMPWTDAEPAELRRGALQFFWRQRAAWTVDEWHLPLAVLEGGALVGVQGITGDHFACIRAVDTGSWLGLAHQGRGIGKEMRAAVLHLAFDGLGAIEAYSAAWHDNHASIAVSRALGYLDNGIRWKKRREERAEQLQFRLPREVWEQKRRDDIEIEGLAPCLAMFGADDAHGQMPSQAPSSSANEAVSPVHS
jgi:RimJ/RimL family protein N-acetyltransferase